MSRGKVKKRPLPADSTKPPKPKQPRVSKVSKKGSVEKNAAPTSPESASQKKKKKIHSAGSDPPAKGAKKQLAPNVNGAIPSGKKENVTPDKQIAREATGDEAPHGQEIAAVSDGAAVVKEAKKSTPGSSPPPAAKKSSKVKVVKPKKKRPSSPTSAPKKGEKLKSAARNASESAVEGVLQSGRHGQKTGPVRDASALDDSSSESDDDVVITRVSFASDVVPDIAPQEPFGVGTPIPHGDGRSGATGMKEKPGLGGRASTAADTGVRAPFSVGFKVGGEVFGSPHSARLQARAGATPKGEKASGTPQTKRGDMWVPPAEMLAPVGPFPNLALRPDPVQRLSADTLLRRAHSSGESSLLDSWAEEPNLGAGSGLMPALGGFHMPGLQPNIYQLDSFDTHLKAGSNHFLLQDGPDIALPQMSGLDGFDSAQEAFPSPPSLAKTVQPRPSSSSSLDFDTSLHSSSHQNRSHSGASPDQGREQQHSSSGGIRPTLRATTSASPHLRSKE